MNIRRATLADAPHFVQVYELASEGLAQYLWRTLAKSGEDARDIGLARTRARLVSPSNRATVAELNGAVCGGMITYDIAETPEAIEDDTDRHVVPLIELENLALGTHYVNVLAVFPGYEGRGIGSALLDTAFAYSGARETSLVVDDVNTRAVGLYRRHGFQPAAARPMVKQNWQGPGTEYVLMRRAA